MTKRDFYRTSAGNVVGLRYDEYGCHLIRHGYFDQAGEYHEITPAHFATVSRDWQAGAIKSGALKPMVRLIGGSVMDEAEYHESKLPTA